MVSIVMKTPQDLSRQMAARMREKRLSLNLTQKSLSERSGVSYGVLKKFEHTGQISLESLLKLALILGFLDQFDDLFSSTTPELPPSLEALFAHKGRQRGRK